MQSSTRLTPVWFENVPIAQAVGVSLFVGQKYPAGHGVGDAQAAPQKLPLGHRAQSTRAVAPGLSRYVFEGQGFVRATPVPAGQKYPGGHSAIGPVREAGGQGLFLSERVV